MTETKRLLIEIAKLPNTFVNYRANVVVIAKKTPNGVIQTSVWLNRKGTEAHLIAILNAGLYPIDTSSWDREADNGDRIYNFNH